MTNVAGLNIDISSDTSPNDTVLIQSVLARVSYLAGNSHTFIMLAGETINTANKGNVTIAKAGGTTLDSQINTLVAAMATFSAANPGFNPTTATSMPTDQTLQGAIAAAWHH